MSKKDSGGSTGDRTRGTGPDKTTQAVDPDLDAPPNSQSTEDPDSSAPDSARGGCLKFGWGCLPVLAALLVIPTGLMF